MEEEISGLATLRRVLREIQSRRGVQRGTGSPTHQEIVDLLDLEMRAASALAQAEASQAMTLRPGQDLTLSTVTEAMTTLMAEPVSLRVPMENPWRPVSKETDECPLPPIIQTLVEARDVWANTGAMSDGLDEFVASVDRLRDSMLKCRCAMGMPIPPLGGGVDDRRSTPDGTEAGAGQGSPDGRPRVDAGDGPGHQRGGCLPDQGAGGAPVDGPGDARSPDALADHRAAAQDAGGPAAALVRAGAQTGSGDGLDGAGVRRSPGGGLDEVGAGDGPDLPGLLATVGMPIVQRLVQADILTPADLLAMTRKQLLDVPRIGRQTANAIEAALGRQGLSLASEPVDPSRAGRTATAASQALQSLWRELVEIRGRGELKLTQGRRKALRSRVAESSEDEVRMVARWVHASRHQRAAYLREGGYDTPDTYLRASKFPLYLELAREPEARVVTKSGDIIDLEETRRQWAERAKKQAEAW